MEWIKCEPGHMPEDDKRYKGKKTINVLVTTDSGVVTNPHASCTSAPP